MAYRKTENILAREAERKAAILQALLDVAGKHGLEAATTAAIAKRGKFSEGVIFKYYADKTELVAAAIAHMLHQHLELLRANDLPEGVRAWARAVGETHRMVTILHLGGAYREGIKKELHRKLTAAGAERPSISCAVIYGAVLEIAPTMSARDEMPLLASLMRACGLRVRVEP